MRRFFLVVVYLMIALVLHAQQSKQVFITLDVSASMSGDKYVLANYTTQMIVTLCNEDDDIHMIVYGQEKNLSDEKNPLAVIQKPFGKLNFGIPGSTMSQFDDIVGFNKVFNPSKDKDNWLFIIGDGDWGSNNPSYAQDLIKFQDIVKSGDLNVCYLQTGKNLSDRYDFTVIAENLGLVDILKSSIDPQTIMAGCDHFAKKILGFSGSTLDIKKDGAKTVKLVAEMPVKELLLVYQDEVAPENLPKIIDAKFNGNQLEIQHKGTPTTRPIRTGSKNLSGHVWRIKTNGTIPANEQIEMTFDKDVNTNKITVYPVVDEISFGTAGLTRVGDGLKQIADNTFSICRDENTAIVYVELNEGSGNDIPEQLLKKAKVVVKANNKEYPARYSNGRFECEIDLNEEKTQYYAECDCPGYFSRVTPITTIVKGDCEPVIPPTPPIKEFDITDFGTKTFNELRNGPIKGTLYDIETLQTLNPNDFDFIIEIEDDFMYDEPKLRIQGNTILIDVHPKGDWCECLFPTDLNIKLISTPKAGAFSGSDRMYAKTVHPIHLKVVKENSWLSRCSWVIIALLGVILFFIYMRLLMKKKRFKKNAMMTPRYYTYYGDLIDDQGGMKLRKGGFGAWFARWLLPGDERVTLSFDKPLVSGLTLRASDSKDVVNVLKGSCDFNTMDIDGYDPETDTDKSKFIKMGDGTIINITDSNGSRDGELTFSSGSENDGAGYRIFLGLLMILSILAMLGLLFIIFKSL